MDVCEETRQVWRCFPIQSTTSSPRLHQRPYIDYEEMHPHVMDSIMFKVFPCGFPNILESPTVIYENNATCIAHIKVSYIKGDRIKHILPKSFLTHELLGSNIDVKQARSSDNLSSLFTKSLPTTRHRQIIQGIGMQRFFIPT